MLRRKAPRAFCKVTNAITLAQTGTFSQDSMRGFLFAGGGGDSVGCTVAGEAGGGTAREASAASRVTVAVTVAMSHGKTAHAVRLSISQ